MYLLINNITVSHDTAPRDIAQYCVCKSLDYDVCQDDVCQGDDGGSLFLDMALDSRQKLNILSSRMGLNQHEIVGKSIESDPECVQKLLTDYKGNTRQSIYETFQTVNAMDVLFGPQSDD
jgi:hypothetical protein